MAMTTEEIARRWDEAGSNLDARMLLFSDDAVYTSGGPARGSRYEGKAAVRGAMERAVTKVFDVASLKSTVITTKDHIIRLVDVTGKSRITGRPYANKLLFLQTVKDGKIVHQHEYLDTIASARALGDLPYPDQAAGQK